ncbi:hypothetical protein [Pseudomonas sp. McL0111]|uniref:hypothetical protein n=1 Tax=Pseudomonas sp. McL0111 TaxID=3457357 RepID=UPI00403EBA9D
MMPPPISSTSTFFASAALAQDIPIAKASPNKAVFTFLNIRCTYDKTPSARRCYLHAIRFDDAQAGVADSGTLQF